MRSHSVASAEVRNLPPLDPIRSPANSLVMQGDRFPMSTSTYNSPFTQVLAINGQSNDAINHSSAHEESEIEIRKYRLIIFISTISSCIVLNNYFLSSS